MNASAVRENEINMYASERDMSGDILEARNYYETHRRALSGINEYISSASRMVFLDDMTRTKETFNVEQKYGNYLFAVDYNESLEVHLVSFAEWEIEK